MQRGYSKMTPDQVQLLIASVVALLTAVTAYVGARQVYISTTVKQHDIALNGPTVARDARITALEVAGGQNMSRVPPAWNQLNDPMSNGQLPAMRTQECGEEVVAMMVMWRHGVPLSADALRAMLNRPDASALTTAADVAALLTMCNVEAKSQALSWSEAQRTTRVNTGAGNPVAVLVSVPTGGYHWLCCYSSDDAYVHYIDPWGGMRDATPWAAIAARYAGSLVTVAGPPDVPVTL